MLNSFSRRAVAAFSALLVGTFFLTGAQAQSPKPTPTPKTATKTAPKSGRKIPMRDPKTGRFMKASPSPTPSATPLARDPKTGRFMKKTPKGVSTPTPDRIPKPGQ